MSKKNIFYNKKILVAGGTGLIGANLCNKLESLGAKVISCSVDGTERAKKVLVNPKSYRYCDFRDKKASHRVTRNIDILINLMGVRESTQLGITRSASALSTFLVCNTNIIESACINKVKNYLFCGSINQYPPIPVRNEEDVWRGLPSAQDRYVGMAKRIGEIQAEAYSKQFNWNAVRIIRPSNVYGPYDNFDPKTAHVIPSLIHKALNSTNGFLKVAGDGSAIRDFIYVEDVVEAILLVIKSKETNIPFNIGSGKGISIKELVKIIIKNFKNKKITIKWDKKKPTGDKKRVLNISRAKKRIKFFPKTNIQEGIKKTIIWYTQNTNLGLKLGRTYDKKVK